MGFAIANEYRSILIDKDSMQSIKFTLPCIPFRPIPPFTRTGKEFDRTTFLNNHSNGMAFRVR